MPLAPKPLIARTLEPGTFYSQEFTRYCPRNIIYGLAEPGTTNIRFVGKSSWGLMTPLSYRCPSNRRQHTLVECWVAGLLSRGLGPEVYVLEELPDRAGLMVARRKWVAHLRSQGVQLLNERSGKKSR